MPDPSGFEIPIGIHRAEQTIERSRFVATLGHAADRDSAHALIRSVRNEWPDATHHCTAWNCGPPGDTGQIGMSDDGEPRGTAGRPMLNILLHSEVGEVVAVVTRWYGGTKLGTGGLARAYSGTVDLALATLPRTMKIDWLVLEVSLGYGHVSSFKRLLDRFQASTTAERFDQAAHYSVKLPREHRIGFVTAVADATRGEAEVANG